ncbi:putative HAF family extracellular repeat protein [Ochrobactrum sp. 19YEA23]|nr:putative HAF family extracellular repeat protein [Ochrobactrum sp. 19YEA23]
MNILNKHLAYLLIGTSSLLGCAHAAMAQQPDYGAPVPVADLGGVNTSTASSVTGISLDGKVVVGSAARSNGSTTAPVMWNGGALIELGTLDSGVYNAKATAVSGDGSVIVGSTGQNGHGAATIWRADLIGPQYLDPLNNAYQSTANNISRDGKVIVGSSNTTALGDSHAMAWATNGTRTDLGSLGGSYARAQYVSADGSVIAGQADTAGLDARGVAWFGGLAQITDLGTLGGKTSGTTAVSSDGAVIVGYALTLPGDTHAVAWSDGNQQAVNLGALGGTSSIASAVSGDGKVIVGQAALDNGDKHATAWLGDALTPTDLGNLGGATSAATLVSNDGTVIAGNVTTSDTVKHAALWKLVTVTPPDPDPDPNPKPDPDPNVNPTPTPDPTPTPVGIDVTNTVDTVAALAHDTFSVMGSQGAIVGRLMGGSSSGQGFNDFSGAGLGMAKAGENWYGIYSDVGRAGDSKDVLGWMTLGHAFTDNFSAGATIAHTFWQDMPDNYDRTNNNIGGGIYAQWKDTTQSGTWYMRGSAAINRYDVERTRQVLGYTEPGTGDSTINGWGVQLEAGQSFDLGNKTSLGYYGGLSYTDLKMDGYTETNAYFPFTYSDVKSQRTTAYFGLNYGMALTDKVNWSVNAEIEQDLSHKDPSVIASADYIGAYEFGSDTAHTRGSLSTTVSYAFSDAVSIGVTPYVNRTLDKDTAFGAIIGLSGKF